MQRRRTNGAARRIERIYLALLLFHTLAASLIWGINTLFLLDAGLSNVEAFGANAFFTAGFVLFEVPTGVVADTRGRRLSYLLGTLTLSLTTVLLLVLWQQRAPFWAWAAGSLLTGLGFTFFSGAVEAWLVDALTDAGYFADGGALERVFARGEIVEGVGMFCGSVGGGVLAQATGSLGTPYVLRALLLAASFGLAFKLMHDVGFTPTPGKRPLAEVRKVLRASIAHGLGKPPIRWVMLAAPFADGVSYYAFYAMQPYLLQLYGSEGAYSIAGLAAAILSLAQVAGGLLVPAVRRAFRRRTSVLLAGVAVATAALGLIGLLPHFTITVALLIAWGLVYAIVTPIRRAYLNDLIPSQQRATVLSFDSLLASSGAVVTQPLLGRAADVWGYPASYACSAALQAIALPFLWAARRQHASADEIPRE